jgi:hypothetical protein
VPLLRPYKRTFRPNKQSHGDYYVRHPGYASNAVHYVRAFDILATDFRRLSDYIEPSDDNLKCYSFRTHEIFMRSSIEVEANLKAILLENGYANHKTLNMKDDYRKIKKSHRLSSYVVRLPSWRGTQSERRPFQEWSTPTGTLAWYNSYNAAKHDRDSNFSLANFESALDALCGLAVLLCAQFEDDDFSAREYAVQTLYGPFFSQRAGFLLGTPAHEWPDAELYDFDWNAISSDLEPFQNYPFPNR